MNITVTQKHIKRGEPCESQYCPVALALKERFPHTDVSVSEEEILVNGVDYHVPRSVSRFVTRFDANNLPRSKANPELAKPFTFKLEKL